MLRLAQASRCQWRRTAQWHVAHQRPHASVTTHNPSPGSEFTLFFGDVAAATREG